MKVKITTTVVLISVLLLVLPGAAQTQPQLPVILAFGDSLTAGYGVSAELSYPSQLQKELDKLGYKYRVVNHGVSGSTTVEALGRMQRALSLQPAIVILELGGNDAEYRIPPEVTRENLGKMIQRFKAGGTRVFLAERIGDMRGLAKEMGVETFPFLDGVAGRRDLLLADGRHPTGEGYTIVVQNILKAIEPAIRARK